MDIRWTSSGRPVDIPFILSLGGSLVGFQDGSFHPCLMEPSSPLTPVVNQVLVRYKLGGAERVVRQRWVASPACHASNASRLPLGEISIRCKSEHRRPELHKQANPHNVIDSKFRHEVDKAGMVGKVNTYGYPLFAHSALQMLRNENEIAMACFDGVESLIDRPPC